MALRVRFVDNLGVLDVGIEALLEGSFGVHDEVGGVMDGAVEQGRRRHDPGFGDEAGFSERGKAFVEISPGLWIEARARVGQAFRHGDQASGVSGFGGRLRVLVLFLVVVLFFDPVLVLFFALAPELELEDFGGAVAPGSTSGASSTSSARVSTISEMRRPISSIVAAAVENVACTRNVALSSSESWSN